MHRQLHWREYRRIFFVCLVHTSESNSPESVTCQSLVLQPSVKKFVMIILFNFAPFAGWWSNLVFGVLDRLMVKPVSYTSN